MKTNHSTDFIKMKNLSKHYEDVGWTRIVRFIVDNDLECYWINQHNMNVYHIPLKMELWFQNIEDAMAFKLRWV